MDIQHFFVAVNDKLSNVSTFEPNYGDFLDHTRLSLSFSSKCTVLLRRIEAKMETSNESFVFWSVLEKELKLKISNHIKNILK